MRTELNRWLAGGPGLRRAGLKKRRLRLRLLRQEVGGLVGAGGGRAMLQVGLGAGREAWGGGRGRSVAARGFGAGGQRHVSIAKVRGSHRRHEVRVLEGERLQQDRILNYGFIY